MKKNHPLPKEIRAGRFQIGWDNVDLILLPSSPISSFKLCPEKDGKLIMARIEISLDYPSWAHCLSALIHEAFEHQMVRQFCRYEGTGRHVIDHGDYLFLFNHVQFSTICQGVAEFCACTIPIIAEHYNRLHKKKP